MTGTKGERMDTKTKIRYAFITSIPLVLVALAVFYVKGADAKILTAWSFLMGAFSGAFTATVRAGLKGPKS